MSKMYIVFSCILTLFCCLPAAQAQMSSPNFKITTSVLSGGGGAMESDSFKADATLGQPTPLMDPDDPPMSFNYANEPGFWYTIEAELADVCEGDFDEDGDVDGTDLADFSADFGRTDCSGDCAGDFDDDGDVDGTDLAVFSADFGRTDCPVF